MLQHKPRWYAPPRLDEAARRAARRRATVRADAFGDLLVRRVPFDFVLLEEDVNRWLASAPELWPRAEGATLRDPVLRFEPGAVRVGALVERGGWRAVVSVAVGVRLTDDGSDVELRLMEARGGSLPIPLSVLAWAAGSGEKQPQERAGSSDGGTAVVSELQSVDELLAGVRRRNWFVWPNGDRAFSVASLSLTPGRLSLRIRPN